MAVKKLFTKEQSTDVPFRVEDLTAQQASIERFPPYQELFVSLKQRLAESGFLALLLIDVSDINWIEKHYGSRVYDQLMRVVREVVAELREREFRRDDLIAVNEKAGDIFMIFLVPRSGDDSLLAEDLEKVGDRVEEYISRRINKLAFPILRKHPEISVGTSLVLRNPILREERLIVRGIEEAKQAAQTRRELHRLKEKQLLQRVILKNEIETVFQPIIDLESGKAHGFEALARGPRGTSLRNPGALFAVAERTDLLSELDHICRRTALHTAGKLERQYKLFINTYPFSMLDPSFQGKYLIDLFEGTELSPDQIVLEVTERLAIENYTLFVDAMRYFSDMGCLIAIDDMGAGFSSLEQIVHLAPDYVKLDMYLVRDVDTSFVKQQIFRAFRGMAENIGARIIAEGVETQEELDTVREIGVDCVQGHFLGRPAPSLQFPPVDR